MNAKPEEAKTNIRVLKERDLRWFHIQNPTDDDVFLLHQEFPQFSSLDLEDILYRHRPKIDEYPEYLFVVLEFPFYDEKQQIVCSNTFDALIGKDFLVTIDGCGGFENITQFVHSCEADTKLKKECTGKGAGYLFYRILDLLIDRRMGMLDRLGDEINTLKANMFSMKAGTFVKRLSLLKQDAISLWQVLAPLRDVLRDLGPKLEPYARTDIKSHVRDVNNQLNDIWREINEYREIIESLHGTYNSIATYRLNEAVRILTIIMTVGTILAVIVGFFGMNIPLGPLGSNPGGSGIAWFVITIVSLTVTLVMLLYFWRKGWM